MKKICIPGYLLSVVLILQFTNTEAQLRIIHGKVTDSATGHPVEYAYVLNFSQHKQMYCNSKGEFQIDAGIGDTVVMYALGYDYHKIIIDNKVLAEANVNFKLNQQSYDLNEARIVGIGTYNDFRQKFITMERPLTKIEQINNSIAEVSRNVAREAFDNAMAKQTLENGVTFMRASILTPEEIERIKLGKIMEIEKVKDQVYHKFNPMIVKQITGLTDDDEIISFMLFCKFSDTYLLEVNEYDLAARIALKFEVFKKNKEDEKMMQNPVNYLDQIMHILA